MGGGACAKLGQVAVSERPATHRSGWSQLKGGEDSVQVWTDRKPGSNVRREGFCLTLQFWQQIPSEEH